MSAADDIKARIERCIAAATPKDIATGCVSEDDETPRSRRRRRPTLASTIKQARKLGMQPAAATVRPDGTVTLEFGQRPALHDAASNEWDAEYGSGSAEVH